MPYVGCDSEPARKRRWQDDEDSTIFTLYRSGDDEAYHPLGHRHQYSPRKTIPLSKRARFSDNGAYASDLAPAHCRRSTVQKPPQHSVSLENRPSNKDIPNPLQPCHICHRKPTKKSDLDSFADCQGCQERTCFVCLRECYGRDADRAASVLSEQEALSRSFHMEDADAEESINTDGRACRDATTGHLDGPDAEVTENTTDKNISGWVACGHRSVVCSRCCIERGAEGEVVCLGCLSEIDFR